MITARDRQIFANRDTRAALVAADLALVVAEWKRTRPNDLLQCTEVAEIARGLGVFGHLAEGRTQRGFVTAFGRCVLVPAVGRIVSGVRLVALVRYDGSRLYAISIGSGKSRKVPCRGKRA